MLMDMAGLRRHLVPMVVAQGRDPGRGVCRGQRDLTAPASETALGELSMYVRRLHEFLTKKPRWAGLGYLALLGEAQHDPTVAGLLAEADMLSPSARITIECVAACLAGVPGSDLAVAQLVGPIVYAVMSDPGLGSGLDADLVRLDHPRALVRGVVGSERGSLRVLASAIGSPAQDCLGAQAPVRRRLPPHVPAGSAQPGSTFRRRHRRGP